MQIIQAIHINLCPNTHKPMSYTLISHSKIYENKAKSDKYCHCKEKSNFEITILGININIY